MGGGAQNAGPSPARSRPSIAIRDRLWKIGSKNFDWEKNTLLLNPSKTRAEFQEIGL